MKNDDNTLMWIALAVGAFFLWQWYQGQSSSTASSAGTSTPAGPQPTGPGGIPVYSLASQQAYIAANPQYSDVGMAASLPAFTGPVAQGS
jgi:hypothetical protein